MRLGKLRPLDVGKERDYIWITNVLACLFRSLNLIHQPLGAIEGLAVEWHEPVSPRDQWHACTFETIQPQKWQQVCSQRLLHILRLCVLRVNLKLKIYLGITKPSYRPHGSSDPDFRDSLQVHGCNSRSHTCSVSLVLFLRPFTWGTGFK